MSNEVAIVEPLSGAEVIEAVVHKIREQLQRDCYLSPNSAYEKFSVKIHVEVRAVDCGRTVEVAKDVEVQGGAPIEMGDDVQTDTESDAVIEEAPPNVVRRETEQPIPVMTEDGSGRKEIRRVKYQKKA